MCNASVIRSENRLSVAPDPLGGEVEDCSKADIHRQGQEISTACPTKWAGIRGIWSVKRILIKPVAEVSSREENSFI
jgi:hypothetical protein